MKKNKTNTICIIPARGGSKRIKNKNIKKFHKKPLIFFSIRNALKSKLFSNVYVSTDSKKIRDISIKYGAKVPFLRPKKLADDKTIVKDVLKEFLENLKMEKKVDYFCCLYPTAPLIDEQDLKNAYKKFLQNNANALISISKYNNHPLRSIKISNKQNLSFKFPKYQNKNTQDLQELYQDAGAFYIYKVSEFLKLKKELMPKKTIPFILNKSKVVDIDDMEDFDLASKLFKIK